MYISLLRVVKKRAERKEDFSKYETTVCSGSKRRSSSAITRLNKYIHIIIYFNIYVYIIYIRIYIYIKKRISPPIRKKENSRLLRDPECMYIQYIVSSRSLTTDKKHLLRIHVCIYTITHTAWSRIRMRVSKKAQALMHGISNDSLGPVQYA